MRINGEWLLCDDGVVRPIVRGEAKAADGFWEPVLFLLDIGADLTVFDASTLDVLELDAARSPNENIGGLGGTVESVIVDQPQSVVCLLSQRHHYRIETV